MSPLIPCLPIEFLLDPPDLSLIQNDEQKRLELYSRTMGFVSSLSVRSICVGARTGEIRSEREEEESLESLLIKGEAALQLKLKNIREKSLSNHPPIGIIEENKIATPNAETRYSCIYIYLSIL